MDFCELSSHGSPDSFTPRVPLSRSSVNPKTSQSLKSSHHSAPVRQLKVHDSRGLPFRSLSSASSGTNARHVLPLLPGKPQEFDPGHKVIANSLMLALSGLEAFHVRIAYSINRGLEGVLRMHNFLVLSKTNILKRHITVQCSS